jgi:hypothetical protein
MALARPNQATIDVPDVDTTGRCLTESGVTALGDETSSKTAHFRITDGSEQPVPVQCDHRRLIDLRSAADDPDGIGRIAAAPACADIASTNLDNRDTPPPLPLSAPDDLTQLVTAGHGGHQ